MALRIGMNLYPSRLGQQHTKLTQQSTQTAATMTMNSPESMLELYRLATSPAQKTASIENQPLYAAELMREVGLKCIGFNGVSVSLPPTRNSFCISIYFYPSHFPPPTDTPQVPRTINVLGAFYTGLPADIQTLLRSRRPRRNLSRANVDAALTRGAALWDSIYRPFSDKLTAKLAQSHPDLPVHIIESEYGGLFSDPPAADGPGSMICRPDVGRVLTSVVAVACLRAQGGVGPQVVSHVFGLRKAFEDGTAEGEELVGGGQWLASNEGSLWLLELVDRIVHAIGGGQGTTFAPGFEKAPRAKL
jgi:hypothetical protein